MAYTITNAPSGTATWFSANGIGFALPNFTKWQRGLAVCNGLRPRSVERIRRFISFAFSHPVVRPHRVRPSHLTHMVFFVTNTGPGVTIPLHRRQYVLIRNVLTGVKF